MRYLKLVFCSFFLAGCSSVPSFELPKDNQDGPTVAQVIDKVYCELAEARNDPRNGSEETNKILNAMNAKPFKDWQANVILTLTVNDMVGLTPNNNGLGLTFIDPFKAAGTAFSFSFNPILYQTRSRTFTQQFSIDFSKMSDTATCASMKRDWDRRVNLEGDLGLRDQVYMGLHSLDIDVSGAKFGTGGKAPDNVGATVSFHIYKGISNLGPSWKIVRFVGPVGGVGLTRDDLHQVAVTITPVGKEPPKPAECKAPISKPVLLPTPSKLPNESEEAYARRILPVTQLNSARTTDYTMKLLEQNAVCGSIVTGKAQIAAISSATATSRLNAQQQNILLNNNSLLLDAIKNLPRN